MLTVRIQAIDGTGTFTLSELSALSAAHFPPPALPGFRGTANLSATPERPASPSRASGWSSLTTPWGFPCCVRFPCVHAVATTPAQRLGVLVSLVTQPCQPSPIWLSGRPAHCPFRGLLGVHSRYGLHTRAVTVYRDQLSEGFSHFVSSIAAPVASGWSGCRVGLSPTGKRRLVTAHTRTGLTARSPTVSFDHLIGDGQHVT